MATKKELEAQVERLTIAVEQLEKRLPLPPTVSGPGTQYGRTNTNSRGLAGVGRRKRPAGDVEAVPPGSPGSNYTPRNAAAVGAARGRPPYQQQLYPGVTGPDAPESKYDTERPVQPLPYIQDVNIDRNWFSPFQPIWPFGPPYVTTGRAWDYPTGINMEFEPRRVMLYNFLQTLADNSSILRTVIEARKDQIASMPWGIVPRAGGKPTGPQQKRIDEIMKLFSKPDGHYRSNRWTRLLLDDKFTIDASTIYIHKDLGGKPLHLRVYQGDTMRVMIDDAGMVPDPPSVAYQQVIKGLPMNNFDQNEMIYAPYNPRPRLPIYGMSEVEFVYLICVTEIRREIYQGQFYIEGSIPDLILESPEQWTPQQMAEYQAFFDNLLSGNPRLKSKARFMPPGVKVQTPKGAFGEFLKAGIDEWTARIICAAFHMPPTAFVAMMNRATAQTHVEQARDEGLPPYLNWLKEDIFDPIIQEESIGFGYDDLEQKFTPREELDPNTRLTVDLGYLKVGVKNRNEVREGLALDPIPGGDEYVVITPQGDVPIGSEASPIVQQSQQKDRALDIQQQQADTQAKQAAKPAPKPTSKTAEAIDLLKFNINSETEREMARIVARQLDKAKNLALKHIDKASQDLGDEQT